MDNPTGHYRLDLSVETDRQVRDLAHLRHWCWSDAGVHGCCSSWHSYYLLPVTKRTRARLVGTGIPANTATGRTFETRSSTMRRSSWRVRLPCGTHPRAWYAHLWIDVATGDFDLFGTPAGVLDFDYTSTQRPKRYARKMRRKAYVALGTQLKKMLGTLNIRKPTANEKNTQWIPPFVEAEEELHEDSPEALEKYPPLLYAMDGAKRWCMGTSNRVVCAVRWAPVIK